ncbi:MAG: CidA/LrgA family protein [Lachnospiraceae bacterium]|nr:CidA/LrgA family protein [Lachnospiraceae bacterium]
MNYLKQLMIILLFTFGGEVLHALLPFPVPGSIYGLLLLFLCLEFGAVKAESIRETATWLVEMIPVMFVPAGAGLLKSWGVLRPILWQVAVITLVSTVAVMVASGKATQAIISFQAKRGGHSRGNSSHGGKGA